MGVLGLAANPMWWRGQSPPFLREGTAADHPGKGKSRGWGVRAAPLHCQACPPAPAPGTGAGQGGTGACQNPHQFRQHNTRLFVTECAVAHCLQRDVVSLPPQGLTSRGWGEKRGDVASPQ